ncbi:MAG: amidohydrolase family protein [Anaerolineales bacterium]|nr:amidohydrolase family protein [Anaerolineales bacterium]
MREEKALSLQEAVKKMTSTTANHFGLTDRGVIYEGAWADLVIFNAHTVADQATYIDPHRYPVGIPYVIVNGVVVIDRGRHTDNLPGHVL